jgi:prepilin signal peptidase PulO-like enzyme (type II secretory pathway)
VVALWIGLPPGFRLLLLALLGLVGGALANYVIYRFAYFNPRAISPWGPSPEGVTRRRPSDRIPVWGWLGLRRESSVHGRGFWIRPLLIELTLPMAMLWLYQFETQSGGLLPQQLRFPQFLIGYESTATQIFFCHAVLLILMVAATFIDFDERTIPDIITIPGTLFALVLASLTSEIFMPTSLVFGGMLRVIPTTFDSPWFVPQAWMASRGLGVGLGIWSMWCFALADWRWSGALMRRRGLRRAVRHFTDGLFHYGYWKVLAVIWCLGVLGIVWVWSRNGSAWLGLFSSLVGLAVGGGVIWAIRIVATWALNMEAMGFGDVTLMGMIGALIGWQAALIAFFLSPFAAIAIVLVRYIITRDAYTPFGPYLCAGTVLTVLWWDRLYSRWLADNLLLMGPILLWLSLAMLGLMAVMLFVWRQLKLWLLRGH